MNHAAVPMPEDIRTLVLLGLVSSGKSTLANALSGQSLMPTNNLACTSMAVTLVDPAGKADFPTAILLRDGTSQQIPSEQALQALMCENDAGGGEFFLKMRLNKLNHGQFPVAMSDTPGVNDAMTDAYGMIAAQCLRSAKNPTVLYVSHVRTCTSTDEVKSMRSLASEMKELGISRWFVALNGWNLTDPVRESREKYQEKIFGMAEKCGLPRPEVFFVAALPAQLSARALAGGTLSERETNELNSYLRRLHLADRAEENLWQHGRIGNKILRTVLYEAGITPLSQALYRHMRRERDMI